MLSLEYLKNLTRNKGNNFTSKRQFLISYTSGLIASLITLPIWTLRTRLSLITTTKTESYLNRMKIPMMLIKDSIFKEGWLNLYKGVLPTIFLSLYGGIQMTIYEKGKNIIASTSLPPVYGSVLGVISKFSASFILYPFNLIRSKQQQIYSNDSRTSKFNMEIQKNLIISSNTYGKFLQTLRIIYAQNGILGYYKGLLPLLIRQIPGSSVFFYTYEYTLKYLNN